MRVKISKIQISHQTVLVCGPATKFYYITALNKKDIRKKDFLKICQCMYKNMKPSCIQICE